MTSRRQAQSAATRTGRGTSRCDGGRRPRPSTATEPSAAVCTAAPSGRRRGPAGGLARPAAATAPGRPETAEPVVSQLAGDLADHEDRRRAARRTGPTREATPASVPRAAGAAVLQPGDGGARAGRRRAARPRCSRIVRTPMRTTSVPPTAASAFQSTVDAGSPGATWPDTTVNAWTTPRCVTGMPAAPGTAIALVTPGTTSTGDPGRDAGLHLLHPAAEDVRVAALEPDHDPPGPCVLDEQPVDLLLRHRPPAGHLGGVDDRHLGGELVQQGQRRQPVGDHHVRLGERGAAAQREQAGVAGAAADQDHPPGRRGRPPARDGRVARARRPRPGGRAWRRRGRVAVGVHRHACTARSARPRGPTRVGLRWRRRRARTGRAGALGVGRDGRVHRRVVGAGHDEPGVREVPGRRTAGATGSRPLAARSARAGVASGATTVTSAPAASRPATRRSATAPPPTTTRRPRSRSPTRVQRRWSGAGLVHGGSHRPTWGLPVGSEK